jgi:hypothetical protein
MRIKHCAGTKAEMAALALSFIMALCLAGCDNPADPAPPDRIYILTANGSADAATTELTITFAAEESGLTADHITIANDTGEAAKNGAPARNGPAYTLPVTISKTGTITVTIAKDGVDGNGHSVMAAAVIRTYTVTANGSEAEATTALTITFAAAEDDLTAEQITLADGTGKAAKNGDLAGNGPAYTLPVTVSKAGTITVTITKDGVDRNPRSAAISAFIPEFVMIPAGRFIMGTPEDETYRHTNEYQHEVEISAFYMSKYEITQREFEAVMGFNPTGYQTPELPVDFVNWYDAVNYCNAHSSSSASYSSSVMSV